jgi:hypothetical protein
MNPDPLAQLRDIHLPAPVNWWPPAPGWWVLALLVVVLVGLGTYILILSLRKKRYRKAALKELALLKKNSAPRTALEQLAALLRRVAIQSFGRKEVVGLTGRKWLDFLDRTGKTDQFSCGAGQALGENLYRADYPVTIDPIFQLVERWIRCHKKC